MFTFQIERWVPNFLLDDKNGKAMAKAIEAALQYMNDIVEAAVSLMDDVENMPEWRLDELAWEYNLPYDYQADVEIKRAWIQNADTLYRLWGTKQGLIQYMDGYFDGSTVVENWEYEGSPYHFRVNLEGHWSTANIAWAVSAIEKLKNVRSVVDAYEFSTEDDVSMPELSHIIIGADGTFAEAEANQNLLVGIATQLLEDRALAMEEEPITVTWYGTENNNIYVTEDNDILIG